MMTKEGENDTKTMKKKTWANVASSESSTSRERTSLATIMADEAARKQIETVAQQEDSDLKRALAASLEQQDDDDDLKAVLALSLQEVSLQETKQGNNNNEKEAVNLQRTVREIDRLQEEESLRLAILLQAQEEENSQIYNHQQQLGNVRVMTRAQLWKEQAEQENRQDLVAAATAASCNVQGEAGNEQEMEGFRINSSKPSKEWTTKRGDRSFVVGPDQELRTKHDVTLQGQANAHRLGLHEGGNVNNRAFNDFHQRAKRQEQQQQKRLYNQNQQQQTMPESLVSQNQEEQNQEVEEQLSNNNLSQDNVDSGDVSTQNNEDNKTESPPSHTEQDVSKSSKRANWVKHEFTTTEKDP